MSRFYVSPAAVQGATITVSGDEAHHIIDVMRLAVSDDVVAFDGTGNEYEGTITTLGKHSLTIMVRATRRLPPAAKVAVTLIQAIPKKEKMDYIVEKATELGVHTLMPVVTDRTIVRWDNTKRAAALTRWRKIVTAAAKQCGRAELPVLTPIQDFKSVVTGLNGVEQFFVAALTEHAQPIKTALQAKHGKTIAIAIGPEGDFTPQEIRAAEQAQGVVVSLGQRVLKSDTAGLAVLAMVNYEYA